MPSCSHDPHRSIAVVVVVVVAGAVVVVVVVPAFARGFAERDPTDWD